MNKRKKQSQPVPSLYSTLTLAFVGITVVALLFSGALQVASNIRSQRALLAEYQYLVAKQTSQSVSNFIQEKFHTLDTAAWLTDPLIKTKEEQKYILESMLGLQPAFRQLVLLDTHNKVLAQASLQVREDPDQLTKLLTEEVLAQIRQGNKYISPVYIDADTNEPLVVMAAPVLDVFHQYQGLILAETKLKFMWDLVEDLKVGEKGYVYVVDRAGNLIAYGDTALVLKGKNLRHLELIDNFVEADPTYSPQEPSTYMGISNDLVVGNYVSLGMPDWAVVTEIPWEEAYHNVILNITWGIIIILVVAGLAALLASTLAKRLASSLINLENTATRIARGEMDLQVAVSGPKEVINLAEAFNSMTAQLRETLANLEAKVAERTQQLQNALNFEKEILSASATGIAVYDETGQCILANEAMAKLVNGTIEQILAQNYHHIESWKKTGLYNFAVKAIENHIETKKELYLETSFGKEGWFNCRFTQFNSNGHPHLLLTLDDINEHKQTEQEIMNLNLKLQAQANHLSMANKELEAFSYSVSHDLRAPLRAINGYAQIIIEDYSAILDDEGRRLFNVICENAQRMSDLIDDLLAFSRLQRAEMQPEIIDMSNLAASVFMELTTPEERARIDFTILDKLPSIKGDLSLMRQVWNNLISNAIKFSSKKPHAEITIGSQSNDSEIVYFIRDNGAGFNMDYSSKLFGVFQRLHTEKDFEGTGVGLAIVQRIIHRHGGRVWAEGGVDQGAVFYFSFPQSAS